MKQDSGMLQKLLFFLLAIHSMNMCAADSNVPEPKASSAPHNGQSLFTKDWRLPESLTNWKLPESIQIHGFASQSYLYTSGNQFFGHTTNTGSLDFTEMGINGSWRPLPNLQTSLQVVYRRAGRTDDSDLRIDFGFLDYSFLSDSENLLGVRLGRVVNPYGLYNDTRDMPFTRPSILLPQSIYFDVNRNFALSGDGIQLYGERQTNIGAFSLQINGIYSRTDDPTLKAGITQGFPGEVEGEPSWLARLVYDWDAGKIRLGITSGELNADYEPRRSSAAPPSGSFSFQPILFSAQYNGELWSLTSEYAIRTTNFSGFGMPDASYTGDSYYVQGSYRFLDGWEGYVRYDVYYANQSDRNGKKYAATYDLPAYEQFAKDLVFGVRWDPISWLMLRAEYHRINGTAWTSTLENSGDTSQHWDLLGLSASVRF